MTLKKRGLQALADFFSRRKTPEAPPTQTTVPTEAQSLEDEIRKSPLLRKEDPFLPAVQEKKEIAPARVRLEQEQFEEQKLASMKAKKDFQQNPFPDAFEYHSGGLRPVKEYSEIDRSAMPTASNLYRFIASHPSDKPLAAKEWIRYLVGGIQKGDKTIDARFISANPNLKNVETNISKEELLDANILKLEDRSTKPKIQIKKFGTKPVPPSGKIQTNVPVGGYLVSADQIGGKIQKEELLQMVANAPMMQAKTSVLQYNNVRQITQLIDEAHTAAIQVANALNAKVRQAKNIIADPKNNLTEEEIRYGTQLLNDIRVDPNNVTANTNVNKFATLQRDLREGKPGIFANEFDDRVTTATSDINNLIYGKLLSNPIASPTKVRKLKDGEALQQARYLTFAPNEARIAKKIDQVLTNNGVSFTDVVQDGKKARDNIERAAGSMKANFSPDMYDDVGAVPRNLPPQYGTDYSYRIRGGEEYMNFLPKVPIPSGVKNNPVGHYGEAINPITNRNMKLNENPLLHLRGHTRFTKDRKLVFLIDEHQLDKQQNIGKTLARNPEIKRLNPYNREYFDDVGGAASLVAKQKKELIQRMKNLDKGIDTTDADLSEIENIRDKLTNLDSQKKYYNLDNSEFVRQYNKLLREKGVAYQPMLQEHRDYAIKMLAKYLAAERPDIDYIGVVPVEILHAAKGRGSAADFSQYGTFTGKAGARLPVRTEADAPGVEAKVETKTLRGSRPDEDGDPRLTNPDKDATFIQAMKSFAKNYNGKIVKVDVSRSNPDKPFKVLQSAGGRGDAIARDNETSDRASQRLFGMKKLAHGEDTKPYVEHVGSFRTREEAAGFNNIVEIQDTPENAKDLYDKYILLELPKDLDKTPVKIYKSKGGLVVDLFKW